MASVRPSFASTIPRELGIVSEAITPVILTFDEAPNIGRTLARLRWAKRVVVVDSFSSDQTEAICSSFPNVQFIAQTFKSHSDQWNFAINQTAIETLWILALDADYVLGDDLLRAIPSVIGQSTVYGWRCHFRYMIFGKPLRGTLYPPVVALFRAGSGRYVQDGHTQRVEVDGPVRDLPGVIYHDDRKPLARWFTSQAKYARLEADHLLSTDRKALGFADRIRLMAWPAPVLAGPYVLFAKGCILDGPAGWYYALQRVLAEILLALELLDRRLRKAAGD